MGGEWGRVGVGVSIGIQIFPPKRKVMIVHIAAAHKWRYDRPRINGFKIPQSNVRGDDDGGDLKLERKMSRDRSQPIRSRERRILERTFSTSFRTRGRDVVFSAGNYVFSECSTGLWGCS